MQVIIELPDDEYESIIYGGGIDDWQKQLVIEAIDDGIPLPKGHGRIADMDAAIKCIEECEGEDAIWAISLIEWACSKRTLIEADKEVEK